MSQIEIKFGTENFYAYAAMYDIAVLPEYQRNGVGTLIVDSILSKIPQCWVVTLFAEPGKEIFYEKFKFSRMNTAMARFKNPTSAKSKGFI